MLSIDLNCDLGEGVNVEEFIMPFISSANISCGYHAGNHHTMKRAVELAIHYGVAIGAHPSFADKANFGRTEMHLEADQIFQIVSDQLTKLSTIIVDAGGHLSHVKPHGALYNMAAKNSHVAAAIVRAVKEFNPELLLFGLSGSKLIEEAQFVGLGSVNEAFIDRTYLEDGSLTPRTTEGAVITDIKKSIQQALNIVKTGSVFTITGKRIPIRAETLCIHSDSPRAPELARQIQEELLSERIKVQPPAANHSIQ
jgi:UPF0271 protein